MNQNRARGAHVWGEISISWSHTKEETKRLIQSDIEVTSFIIKSDEYSNPLEIVCDYTPSRHRPSCQKVKKIKIWNRPTTLLFSSVMLEWTFKEDFS